MPAAEKQLLQTKVKGHSDFFNTPGTAVSVSATFQHDLKHVAEKTGSL